MILGALNFAGFFAFQAFAAHRLPGAVVGTVAATQSLLVALLAVLGGEKLSVRNLVAASLGVLGVALFLCHGSERYDWAGVLAALGLALCSAVGLLLTRRWGVPPDANHLTATGWQAVAGGALLLPAAWLAEGPPPPMNLHQFAAATWLAAAATAVAFALLFGSMHRGLPPTTASRLLLLNPVVAAGLGWLYAREGLSWVQVLGLALVVYAQLAASRIRTEGRTARTRYLRLGSPAGPDAARRQFAR